VQAAASPFDSVFSSQTCRSAGSIVESPLTLIKTRMESSLAFQYTGILQVHLLPHAIFCMESLFSRRRCARFTLLKAQTGSCADGRPRLRATRRALILPICSVFIFCGDFNPRRYAGLFLVLYESLKRSWGKDADGRHSATRTFACSTAAGFVATLATQPFDVLRTRVQLEQRAVRSITRARSLLEQGMSVFLAGFWPRLMKRTLASSVTWTVFEQMLEQLQQEIRPLP
jgi:hypothetical protein